MNKKQMREFVRKYEELVNEFDGINIKKNDNKIPKHIHKNKGLIAHVEGFKETQKGICVEYSATKNICAVCGKLYRYRTPKFLMIDEAKERRMADIFKYDGIKKKIP